jgi:hypothetical protein
MTIESDSNEEIICASCGRPNLPEAVRCWYCQTELKPEGQPALDIEGIEQAGEAADKAAVPPAQGTTTTEKQQPAPAEENIPEWLQRIREKERMEREAEAERDEWQQQALFNGAEKPDASAPAKAAQPQRESHHSAPKKKEKPAPAPQKDTSAEQTTVQPEEKVEPKQQKQEASVIIEEEDETPAQAGTEDLPDGFIKFNSKSN